MPNNNSQRNRRPQARRGNTRGDCSQARRAFAHGATEVRRSCLHPASSGKAQGSGAQGVDGPLPRARRLQG